MNIEVGDRVTYKYININSDELENEIITDAVTKRDYQARFDDESWELIKVERPNWEVVEEKKNLLTEEEREFLKAYLKFMKLENEDMRFKRNYNKISCLFDDGSGYVIEVGYDYFGKMKANYLYTLKELRIGGLNGRRYKKNTRNTKV